jgi:uncharacterized membrane protein
MEICILKFPDTSGAQDALKEVVDAQGDRNPWLHEIGVVSRPLIGRVKVTAAFPDGKSKIFREGDLADLASDMGGVTGYFLSLLAGPLGPMIGAVKASTLAGAAAGDAEAKLFHLDELKKALPRESSALVLIAEPKTCDAMVELFNEYDPQVIRRDVADELRKRLEGLHERVAEKLRQTIEEGAPATH